MALPDDHDRTAGPAPEHMTEQGRKTLDEFVAEIRKNIETLRNQQRSEVRHVFPSLPDQESHFTGEAFVDSVGTVVNFINGQADFFYTPEAIPMRKNTLDFFRVSRRKFFDSVAGQIPDHSRVLNIGAGGDVDPVKCFHNAGHEIISTDMAENTLRALQSEVASPAFACDLANLDQVLLQGSVDVIIGNSTLGYLDPAKVSKIIENLSRAMKHGGVFSFDLAPHPRYFAILAGKREQTVLNESSPDPYELLDLIERYGVEDGLNAMAYYSHYKTLAVNMAVVELIKKEFEKNGMSCATGAVRLTEENDIGLSSLTLRVSKDRPELLQPVEGEDLYGDPLFQLRDEANGAAPPGFIMASLDRKSGPMLAKKFAIPCDARRAPWAVARYIAEHQNANALPQSLKNQVLDSLDPRVYAASIVPYLLGKEFERPKALPRHVALDQTFHKMIILGDSYVSPEVADAKIDAAYAVYEQKQRAIADRDRLKHLLDEHRADRKNKKKKR